MVGLNVSLKVKVHSVNIYRLLSVSVYFSGFLSETQDSCAPAAAHQLCLCLAHSGQSIMCGSSLDRAVLSVPLFRQVQQSPCHHVFITEGNPTTEPRLSYVFSSYTVRTLVSADQHFVSSLDLFHFFLLGFSFFFPTGLQTCLCSTHRSIGVVYRFPPVCFSLRAMAFAGQLRVTFSLTLLGVGVVGSSAIVVISLSEKPGQALRGAQIMFQMPRPQRRS